MRRLGREWGGQSQFVMAAPPSYKDDISYVLFQAAEEVPYESTQRVAAELSSETSGVNLEAILCTVAASYGSVRRDP